MHAWCAFVGSTPDELERTRTKKAAERGGFAQRIVLEETLAKAE